MSGVVAPQGIAGRIRQLRAERGWSAQRLADECAKRGLATLNRGTIAKIESGVRKSVTAEEIDVLGRALGVELNTLVRGSDVASLMAELYFDEPAARSLLLQIGFPAHRLPPFESAARFWREALRALEIGVIADGTRYLIAAAADRFPGNKEVQALHAKLTGAATEGTSTLEETTSEGSIPTLMLIGANLPEEFLQVIREQLGSDAVDLLYVSKEQCAVQIPDPGDNAARLQQQLQEIMQTYAADAKLQVIYEKPNFRPYLYSGLTVFGPDTTPYLLQSVPATLTPRDIAAAIVQETRAMNDGWGGPVSTVIDAETDSGPERLDPDKSLHENKVKDKGKLRVGTKVPGGGPSGSARLATRAEGQQRLLAQIREYGRVNPAFEIVYLDDSELPSRIVVEFMARGFASPENLEEFLAGSERMSRDEYDALPFETLEPVPIRHHRLTIELPPLFPASPPFIIWNTPIFHPNIWPGKRPGYRAGTVFLPQLAEGYEPTLNFADLCQTLVAMASYHEYDAQLFPDLPAARWALGRFGRARTAHHWPGRDHARKSRRKRG